MARFTSKIDARGPAGNIFEVIGKMRRMAKEIGLSRGEIDRQLARVTEERTYAGSLAIVREWFPVETDDEER